MNVGNIFNNSPMWELRAMRCARARMTEHISLKFLNKTTGRALVISPGPCGLIKDILDFLHPAIHIFSSKSWTPPSLLSVLWCCWSEYCMTGSGLAGVWWWCSIVRNETISRGLLSLDAKSLALAAASRSRVHKWQLVCDWGGDQSKAPLHGNDHRGSSRFNQDNGTPEICFDKSYFQVNTLDLHTYMWAMCYLLVPVLI